MVCAASRSCWGHRASSPHARPNCRKDWVFTYRYGQLTLYRTRCVGLGDRQVDRICTQMRSIRKRRRPATPRAPSQVSVEFAQSPVEHRTLEDPYAGLLAFSAPATAHYRISANGPVWSDVIPRPGGPVKRLHRTRALLPHSQKRRSQITGAALSHTAAQPVATRTGAFGDYSRSDSDAARSPLTVETSPLHDGARPGSPPPRALSASKSGRPKFVASFHAADRADSNASSASTSDMDSASRSEPDLASSPDT
jgi:hypothetical protein